MVARAAAIDSALPNSVPPIATMSSAPRRGPWPGVRTVAISSVIPHAPNGMPAGDRLAARHEVGRRGPTAAVSPPGPTTCVWVSSYASNVPVSPGHLAQPLVEARPPAGSEPDVVRERGLGQHDRHVAGPASARSSASRSLNGTTTVRARSRRAGRPSLLRHQRAVLELDQDVVEMAVVLAVEQQHLVAAGRRPGRRGSPRCWPGRRQRELPLRQAVAPRQLAPRPTIASSVGSRNWFPRACLAHRPHDAARARSRRTSTCRRC